MLALACLTLLFMQMGGAHLHLCFDGQEPPTSLHLSSGDHHADHHGGHHSDHHADPHDGHEPHNDLDLPLSSDALTKPGKLHVDVPLLLLAALWLGLLLFARRHERTRDPAQSHASSPQLQLPPLRGPPLPAS